MSSVEQVRHQLVQSELMTAASARRLTDRWRALPDVSEQSTGEDLLAWILQGGHLNQFQVDALRAGQCGPLTFGPYRVEDRLAGGRLGTMYRAVHVQSQHPVVLKVFPASLKDNREGLTRMRRELRVSAQLDHPNVVRRYLAGQIGGFHYLAYEDLRGETLENRLGREEKLDCTTACRLVCDAARGLAHCHDKFIVHRDVQPGNMWITEDGRLKIMELGAVLQAFKGLESSVDSSVTVFGAVLGALLYMSPEQLHSAHDADHRSDIYSLGCTFYHCLTGRPPNGEDRTAREAGQEIRRTPSTIVESVPDLPDAVAETLCAMLAESPDDRLQSMDDVVHSLDQYAGSEAVPAPPTSIPDEFLAWVREPGSSVVDEGATPFVIWLAADSERGARTMQQ